MRRLYLTAALCCTLACAGEQKKDAPVVTRLSIEGEDQVSQRAIRKKILTEKTGWWPFAKKKYFDPVTWQSDLKRIERFYETRGYYQAEVLKDEITPRDDNEVALKVLLRENQPTRISGLEVTGLDGLSAQHRDEVLDDLPLRVGDPFDEGNWANAKRLIIERLRALGHAEAALDGQAQIDIEAGQAKLTLFVRPGIVYRFSWIDVRNRPPVQVDPVMVWEQVRLAVREGELFSDQALLEAQQRVFAMGVFATVRVLLADADPTTGTIPLRVNVQEAPFHTVRTGVGFGVDQVRNEGRLFAEWTNRNFMGGLRKLKLRALGGWAFIPNTYAVVRDSVDEGPRHGPIYRAGVDFEQPRLLGRPALLYRGTIESERTLEQAYNAIGGRLMNGVVWQPRAALSLFPSHNLQAYWLNGPALASAQSAPLALGCAEDPCFITLSYLEETITWDKRDDRLEPRAGYYLSLGLQQGGGPLQGDFTYFRFLPEARAYLSPDEEQRLTFAGKLRGGTLAPTSGDPNDSAVVTRFYAGGGISMRGFNNRRLSPLLLAPAPSSPGTDPILLTMPIGGNGLIEGSFETRYRIGDKVVLAAFFDFGAVTRERVPTNGLNHILYAVGIGVRYLSPVGPIRVDLARRLQIGDPPPLFGPDGQRVSYRDGMPFVAGVTPADRNFVNDSCFGLGGSGRRSIVEDNLCVLHISIGEAF